MGIHRWDVFCQRTYFQKKISFSPSILCTSTVYRICSVDKFGVAPIEICQFNGELGLL